MTHTDHSQHVDSITEELRSDKQRMTKLRTGLLHLFANASSPLSYKEIDVDLKKQKVDVNKTTVYRELEYLEERGIIRRVELPQERFVRYELDCDHHHHHILCIQCGKVQDLEIPNELKNIEKHVAEQTGYKLDGHSLEFWGTCTKCAS